MDPLHVAAGALTGLVVGMTGVGGGALLTPLLLLVFGIAPFTAVGTDLWFAAATKVAVSGLHVRQRLIDWPVVLRLWMGSLPASALTLLWMQARPVDEASVAIVRAAIGVAVCVTALGLLGGASIQRLVSRRVGEAGAEVEQAGTVAAGAALGVLVTLTSVGAGALGVVVLAALYPARLTPPRLVATDIAHAIPLALCAGLGHLAIGHVDGALLRDLLAGSIPAALAGAALATRVPHALLRRTIGIVLLVIGLVTLLIR